MYNDVNKQDDEVKEEFCPSCVVIPLAFAGAGAGSYGALAKGSQKKMRTILLWSGIITFLLSVGVLVWIYGPWKKGKGCMSCIKPSKGSGKRK